MPTYKKPEDADSELHMLLLRAVPENPLGNKTLNHLARTIKVTKWAIRKWINQERIPPTRVVQVVGISEGRVTSKDFDRFVYKA
jgi:hypothetical protein